MIDVLQNIRDGRDATAGWPGDAMNRASAKLAASVAPIEALIRAADAMSRVHIAKGNDSGRRKQLALREALANIGVTP